MRCLLAIVLLSGCGGAGVASAPPMGPVQIARAAQPRCDDGDLTACEALGDVAADTSEAADWYRLACGHFEGRQQRGSACRKVAEIYWDNREADPHYRERAFEFWDQGCHALSRDDASCQPSEPQRPEIGVTLVIPPAPPLASFRDAVTLGRQRADLGDFAGAIAAFRRARELAASSSDAARPHVGPVLELYIGQSFRMAGDLVHAREPLEQFLREWPDAPNHQLVAELVRDLRERLGPLPARRPRPAPVRPLP